MSWQKSEYRGWTIRRAAYPELLTKGPVPQQVVKVKAMETGLAYRTVERAKEILGVISERQGWGPGSACHWRLPPNST